MREIELEDQVNLFCQRLIILEAFRMRANCIGKVRLAMSVGIRPESDLNETQKADDANGLCGLHVGRVHEDPKEIIWDCRRHIKNEPMGEIIPYNLRFGNHDTSPFCSW